MSPALAGGFLTTAPPGKPTCQSLTVTLLVANLMVDFFLYFALHKLHHNFYGNISLSPLCSLDLV